MSKLVECPICDKNVTCYPHPGQVFVVPRIFDGACEVLSEQLFGWVDCPLCHADGYVTPELFAAYVLLKPENGILSIDEIKELILVVGGD